MSSHKDESTKYALGHPSPGGLSLCASYRQLLLEEKLHRNTLQLFSKTFREL